MSNKERLTRLPEEILFLKPENEEVNYTGDMQCK